MLKILQVSLLAVLAAAVLALAPGARAAEAFAAGVHYDVLEIPVKVAPDSKIEVMEFFSYGCVHCYNFDPQIELWKTSLADDVVFDRTPAIFNPSWRILAQAYYAAEALGVLDDIHEPFFRAIHAQGRQFRSAEDVAAFMAGLGVAREDFMRVFTSFSVRSALQQADARGRGYRASGVPTMIVNGKYRVDSRKAGSHENMLKIVDFLVEKERATVASR